MTDKLREAAQAIVDRWDSPAWGGSAENLRHTGEYIAELRAALAQQDAQAVPQGFIEFLKKRAEDSYSCSVLVRDAIAMLNAATPPAQQDAQAVPVVWMGKMDFEALKSRGRVTATLYGEPVGNKTNEVGLCLATPTPPCRRNNHD